jgi:serine/threonine protein kinase
MTGLPEDPRLGTVLSDRYRIDALIGEGGMGRVYSAEHVMMKKRLAVKVLRRELTTVPEVVARFEREAMAAANIDHPNVAAATDFGKLADGSFFLVLEFVMGASLRDEIAEGPMPVERALHITRQIAAGLSSAHAQGIVHRDLKPENVMLVERGADKDFVKVLDFGIAKVPIGEVAASSREQPITRAGMVFGTPEYMSPEQALGQAVDGRADLYSLGIILFEMLSGGRPFSSANPVGILGQQLAHPPPRVAERAPGIEVPPAVEQILTQLLARDREQRFARAASLVSAIDVLLSPVVTRGVYRAPRLNGAAPETTETESTSENAASAPVAPTVNESEGLSASGVTRGALDQSANVPLSSVVPPAQALRERLPQRLRDSLRPVSTRTLVIAAGAIGLLVVALVLALAINVVRGRSASAPPSPLPTATVARAAKSAATVESAVPHPPLAKPLPPEPAALGAQSALPAEVEVASRQGPAALEVLAQKYPLDPNPLVEVARAWANAKDYVRATGAVGRALALDPELSHDDRLAAVLFQTAQFRASADAAFALLEGPMGSRGAEIQWDLAGERQVSAWVRARAGTWLRSPAFRRVAPPALLLTADLRTAPSCEAARALLPKAIEFGDERSLSQLQAWQATTGCGKRKAEDCMPCLRKSSALDDAVAAIKRRAAANKSEPLHRD